MFLAIQEVRRAAVRFSLLALSISLLLFLVLFQQALRNGLLNSFVGAISNQSAPVLVYSIDGQRTLQGSVMPEELERAVLEVDGIGSHGRIAVSTFTAFDEGDEQGSEATLWGTDGALGQPDELDSGRRPEVPGEAIGSRGDFALGERVMFGTDRQVAVTVVGLADDVQLSVTPTLFTDLGTYDEAVRGVNPDARSVPPSVLALEPAAGTSASELVAAINDAVPDADAVTRSDAASTTPGVDQVSQSFRIIFGLYGLVVPLVTGLFFLIVTLQKRRSLTLLRAIGVPAAALSRALAVQVLLITAAGLAVGTALFAPLSGRRIGGLTLTLGPTTILTWIGVFVALAAVGAAASLRRVLRVEPQEAVTAGAG